MDHTAWCTHGTRCLEAEVGKQLLPVPETICSYIADYMDHSIPSDNFPPGQMPTDERVQRHAVGRTETPPSISPGFLHSNSQNYYSGSAVATWVNSRSGSRTRGPTTLAPFGYELAPAHSYNLNMPQTPKMIKIEEDTHPLSYFDSHSTDMSQSKPMLGLSHDCKSSFSDWPAGSHQQQHPNPASVAHTANFPPSPACSSLQFENTSPVGKQVPDSYDLRSSSEDTEDGNADLPYSTLIFNALKSAPGYKLPLQGIYQWFEQNTSKGKDQTSKGWQNSIRHNLSMNAGFEAVKEEATTGKKAGNVWKLTEEAIKNDKVQSTTRYRKQANYRRHMSSDNPAPQRQRSGAKGGKATRVTTRFRQPGQDDDLRKERHRQRPVPHQRRQKDMEPQCPTSSMAPFCTPSTTTNTPMASPLREHYDMTDIVGCTDAQLPYAPIFCDNPGPGPEYLPFDIGNFGVCGYQAVPNGWLAGTEISDHLQLGV